MSCVKRSWQATLILLAALSVLLSGFPGCTELQPEPSSIAGTRMDARGHALDNHLVAKAFHEPRVYAAPLSSGEDTSMGMLRAAETSSQSRRLSQDEPLDKIEPLVLEELTPLFIRETIQIVIGVLVLISKALIMECLLELVLELHMDMD